MWFKLEMFSVSPGVIFFFLSEEYNGTSLRADILLQKKLIYIKQDFNRSDY